MNNQENKSKDRDEKTIFKTKHIPLKNRTSSSGITFWPERVKADEQK